MLVFDPVTLEARVVEDITGDGVTSDDVGVAGWMFSLSYMWRDFVPTGEVDPVSGQAACTFQDHTDSASASSDATGRIVTTIGVTDPSPGACGMELRGMGSFEHDMSTTPGWREYVYNPTFREPLNSSKYLERVLVIGARPVDAVPSLDFGSTVRVYRETSLSGIVFDDWNGDGRKDSGEPGIGGLRIGSGYDYRNQGVGPNDDIITDSEGRFTNIVAEPGGRNSIVFHSGSDDDVRLRTSRVDFHLVSGQVVSDFDVGFFTTPTVRGTVFHDNDGDGARDPDDAVYRGTVLLTDPSGVTRSMSTNSQGEYSFASLKPGIHSLSLPASSIEGSFLTQPVELVICNGNQSSLSFESMSSAAFGFEGDFGVYLGQRLHGRKFDDRNGNGLFDHGIDPPIANAQIEVDVCGQDSARFHTDITATTDAGGFFSTDYVGPGRHLVRQAQSITESASVPVNPGHYEVTVGPDQPSPSFLLFGVTRQLISGLVFDDLNSDGVWQEGVEPPAVGVNVQLVQSEGGGLPRTATTDASGRYDIGHDGPGTYRVALDLPPEYLQTTPLNPAVQQITVARRGENVEAAPFGRGSLVVNDAGDLADSDFQDNVCDVDGGRAGPQCTLRAAIQFSNAKPGLQTISFHLATASGSTIQPGAPLPEVTDPVIIDGGATGVTLLGGIAGNGLTVSAGNSTVRRLTIAGFLQAGVELKDKGDNVVEETVLIGNGAQGLLIREGSVRNTIRKNLIGTDANHADRGNEQAGIEIHAENNILGGDLLADGNRIAFNAAGVAIHVGFNRVQNNTIVANREQGILLVDGNNRVQANLIGTDRDGRELGNTGVGVRIESENNTIGGGDATFGNVIAYNEIGIDVAPVASDSDNTIDNNEILGNAREGIVLREGGDRNVVRRNYVGIDREGVTLGNGSVGIWVASSNNLIGGQEEDAGNIVAFNGADNTIVEANSRAGYGIVVAPLPGKTTAPSGNAILRNRVRKNVGPGIDLGFDGNTPSDHGSVTPPQIPDSDTGPNGLQNAPELVALVFENKMVGRLFSTPNAQFRLEFFGNSPEDVRETGNGSGFLGTIDVTTNAAGSVLFDVPAFSITNDQVITATASRYLGGGSGLETSEFSAKPIRDDDTCGNTELQQAKDEQWRFIQQHIDQIASVDPEGAQHLRQLAQRTGRRQESGCIPVSLERLASILDMTLTHQSSVEENGWWVEFKDLMGSDYDRVSGLMQSSWDGFFDELAALYDNPDYRNERILAFDDFLNTTIHGTTAAAKSLDAFLYEHNTDLLFDAMVFLGNNAFRAETYHALVSQLFAVEAMKKAFDPNVPVEERVSNFLMGFSEISGTLSGVGAAGKFAASRAKGVVSKLTKELFPTGSAARLNQHFFRAIDDAEGVKLLRSLAHGAKIPNDTLFAMGYTDEAITALRNIAKDRNLRLQFRTTNIRSVRFLNEGTAVPKRLQMKAKTINDKDVWLGYDPEHEGLVGLRDPKTLKNPFDTDPCKQNRAELCTEIVDRYVSRQREFEKLTADLDPSFRIEPDGRVIDLNAIDPRTGQPGMPVTGDIDPVAFLRPDGTHLTDAEYRQVLEELRASGAQIQHGAERRILKDMEEYWAFECGKTPPGRDCIPANTPEWEYARRKIEDARRGLERNHKDGKETTLEFREDGEIYRAIITSLEQAESEGGTLIDDLPVDLSEFKRVLRNMNLDIRRDGLSTFDGLFSTLGERRDVQLLASLKRMQQFSPETGIDTDLFLTSTAAEFVALVDDAPRGLHIDPIVNAAEGEGEGNAALTYESILNKIREVAGGQSETHYRIHTKDNGGFVVYSRKAIELSLDVNGDGVAAPIDVLVVINQLNNHGAAPLALWPSLPELRKDVNDDGHIAPIDALVIINYLNSPGFGTEAEGEASVIGDPVEISRDSANLSLAGQPSRAVVVREIEFAASWNSSETYRDRVAGRSHFPDRLRHSASHRAIGPLETDLFFAMYDQSETRRSASP